MLRFIIRRLLLLVPILIGVSILVFVWIRLLPGGPAQALLGERATPQSIAQINHQFGLEQADLRPVLALPGRDVVHLNLGTSITTSGRSRTRSGSGSRPRSSSRSAR